MTKEYIINAAGKKLGRVSSQVAKILMGKTSASFENNKVADVRVLIENADKLDIIDRKARGDVRKRYSGYPGGQRVESLAAHIQRKGHFGAIRLAVLRMLPNNRLRTERMKRLVEKKAN
jgi:large subunit ribosomal protein L13